MASARGLLGNIGELLGGGRNDSPGRLSRGYRPLERAWRGSGSGDRRAAAGPGPCLLELRRKREQRALVAGPADELDGERKAAVALKPEGIDAAGWPVEFQRTSNGTQPVSHWSVAIAPRPSMIPAGPRART